MIWNKEEVPEERKIPSLYQSIKGDKTDCSNYRGISLLQLLTKFYPTPCYQG
jgi:hypothetical protein